MGLEYPAILTGLVIRLPNIVGIAMDGATHLLTNPMGAIRLKASTGEMLENLTALEGSPAFVKGTFGGIESPCVDLIEAYRIGISPLADGGAGDPVVWKAFELQRGPDDGPFPLRGPGDAWPWRERTGPGDTFPSSSRNGRAGSGWQPCPSIARIEEKDGNLVLSVEGGEWVIDGYQSPVARATHWERIDGLFNPKVFSIQVGFTRESDDCRPLKDPKLARWVFSETLREGKGPVTVSIIHPDRQELVEVSHSA